MSYPVFYPVEGTTLRIPFPSYDANGASVTLSGLAVTDIEIYKDGSTTQRASDSGYALLDTDGIDFDGLTGINGFSIDLSDNSDSGFYAVGSQYFVVVSSVTIDSQTVNFIAAWFEIVSATRRLAGTALPNAAADGAGGLPISDAGGLDLDAQVGTKINDIRGFLDTEIASILAAIDTEVAAILAAVDTEVAAIKAKTDLIPGTQDGLTFAQIQVLIAAALLGKASGMGTTTGIFRAADDSKDRITATIDADGNRSAVTLDAS